MTVPADTDTGAQPSTTAAAVDLAEALAHTALSPDQLIDVRVQVPAHVAVALKHRTNGALDVAETISLLVQLYANAPLSPQPIVLTREQHGELAAILGYTPQTVEQLIGGVRELASISFGGVRIKLTSEEVELINARNATELPPKDFAQEIFREMFEAWKNGRI